ncbi:MAG: hypothetical protein BTN85_0538 [Candidatus Methanohalarchaeum thermophilum]|uniref:Transposase n=1 Tax=Methanohalarchaeum thermophilum TaxID=1903181 RepID=A0A1Q6DUN1_METT1|nr:MAG: hypothetical protein BTN85_0538 [Candidatus Methanohalarchaeum thermophilum]
MDKYIDIEKLKDGKDYPLFLRNDTFRVEKAENTKEFGYWAKIPVRDVYGGVWVPVKPHEEIKLTYNIKDSKIVRKDYVFEFHLSVSKEVEPVEAYRGAIGIDLSLNKFAYLRQVVRPSEPLPRHPYRQCTGQVLLS